MRRSTPLRQRARAGARLPASLSNRAASGRDVVDSQEPGRIRISLCGANLATASGTVASRTRRHQGRVFVTVDILDASRIPWRTPLRMASLASRRMRRAERCRFVNGRSRLGTGARSYLFEQFPVGIESSDKRHNRRFHLPIGVALLEHKQPTSTAEIATVVGTGHECRNPIRVVTR